jgi:hypothetical protein
VATTSPPPAGKGFDLKKKVGPLPVWAWSLIGIGGSYLAIRWYKAKKAAAASTSTTTAVPAANSPLPYSGLGAGIGGGYGGGGAGTPWNTTPSAEPAAVSTLPPQLTPVAAPLTAPTPVPIPSAEATARMLGSAPLTPAQANALSVLYQPQNQPGVNPNVSSAPVTQIAPGGSLPDASGVGGRYVTPGAPYAFTFG